MFNEFGSRLGRLIFRISSYNHYCSWSRFAASKEDFWFVQAWTNLADMYLTSHLAAPILVLAPESSTAFSMARRSGRALPFLARNRNTAQKHTSTSTSSENSRFSEQPTEEEVYRGKEYLTELPIEVLLMILSYVQAPDDEHWDDKSDLKAINLVGNKILSDAVKEQLFRYMTLKYTYDHDRQTKQWRVPKLILLMETQPSLAEMVQNHTRAVRLIVLPMPDLAHSYHDLDVGCHPQQLRVWTQHLQLRLDQGSFNAPCIYVPASTTLQYSHATLGQRPDFDRLFGRVMDHNGKRVEEPIVDVQSGGETTREVFASYIFRTMNIFSFSLKTLNHIKAGKIPHDDRWAYNEANYRFTANYGLSFATAIILKHLPAKIPSIRIPSFPLDYEEAYPMDYFSPEATWFCVDYAFAQLRHHAGQIKNLDLDVNCYKREPFSVHPRMGWISSATHYTSMLRKATSLTCLRLTNTSPNNVKDYTAATPYLNKILRGIQLDSFQKLVLFNWTVTPSTFAMLPLSFKKLVRLELESVTMISDDKAAWLVALRRLAKPYRGVLWINVANLKYKDTRSRIRKALSEGLAERVWSIVC